MTNGLEQKTVEAIKFWKSNGLSIDAITYWVFEIGNTHYIEFNTYSPLGSDLEYERHSYVLNTNYGNSDSDTEEMLSEHKAAAYCPGWREKIERLQRGDTVFYTKMAQVSSPTE